MKTGRSVNLDTELWTEVGMIAEREYEGNVSAVVEQLCRDALATRAISGITMGVSVAGQ